MMEHRAPHVSVRPVPARPLVVAMLVFAGLVAPAAGNVPAHAAPSAPAAAGGGDGALASQLRADLDAYLQARGAGEHISGASVSVNRPGQRSTIDVTAGRPRSGDSVP